MQDLTKRERDLVADILKRYYQLSNDDITPLVANVTNEGYVDHVRYGVSIHWLAKKHNFLIIREDGILSMPLRDSNTFESAMQRDKAASLKGLAEFKAKLRFRALEKADEALLVARQEYARMELAAWDRRFQSLV